MNFLIKDTSGKKSLTATAFAVGFLVVNFKLLTSGLTYGTMVFEKFDGSDYGIAVAALGAIYVLRRSTNGNKKDDGQNAG